MAVAVGGIGVGVGKGIVAVGCKIVPVVIPPLFVITLAATSALSGVVTTGKDSTIADGVGCRGVAVALGGLVGVAGIGVAVGVGGGAAEVAVGGTTTGAVGSARVAVGVTTAASIACGAWLAAAGAPWPFVSWLPVNGVVLTSV